MKIPVLIIGTLVAGLAQADTLWSNGPAVDANGLNIHPTNLVGYLASTNFNAALADDFVVPVGGWRVTDLDLFTWTDQNTPVVGGVTLYLFDQVFWSIVSGADVNTGTVVASGVQTAVDGGLVGYNVEVIDLTSKTQGIFDVKADVPDVDLAAGNYWLTWSLSTNLSLPVNASVSQVVGVTGGDAQGRFRGGAYSPLFDATNGGVELPFSLNGSPLSPVPEPAAGAGMLAGLAVLGAALRRRRPARQHGEVPAL